MLEVCECLAFIVFTTDPFNLFAVCSDFFSHLIRLFSQIPVINDDLPLRILSGSVILKPNVKEIRGSTVVFDDGSIVEKVRGHYFREYPQEYWFISNTMYVNLPRVSSFWQVDTIVFATGYSYDFPFLPSNTMYKSGYRVGLYKHVFPPNLEHPTLAVVGFIHALGAIMPQAEMQARWVTRVFKGDAACPV